jgi:WhiB family redox-sensing transcriptional regulator
MAIFPLSWTESAACRGREGALFFPPETGERKEDRLEREQSAKRICQACAVRSECLSCALERHESHGIWGGMNEAERRGLLRY